MEVRVAQAVIGQPRDVRSFHQPAECVTPTKPDIVKHDIDDVRCALRFYAEFGIDETMPSTGLCRVDIAECMSGLFNGLGGVDRSA